MPKAFTESERAQIRKRLIQEAQACLAQYGMRKTTVDELTRRVNIPKGTFYLFYDSKELLFFDVFRALHDSLKAELLSKIKALEDNVTADTVTELIFDLYRDVDATFLYRFAASGTWSSWSASCRLKSLPAMRWRTISAWSSFFPCCPRPDRGERQNLQRRAEGNFLHHAPQTGDRRGCLLRRGKNTAARRRCAAF